MNHFKQLIMRCIHAVSAMRISHRADGVLDDFPISKSLEAAMARITYKDEYEIEPGTAKFLHWGSSRRDETHVHNPYDLYTADIAVFSLKKIGFEEPATMKTIVKKFSEKGYRPLTLQEVVNLRLNFTNQPQMQSKHKMSGFYILPHKHFFYSTTEKWNYYFFIGNSDYPGKILGGKAIYRWNTQTLDLVGEYPWNKDTLTDIAFAAVKIGSEKAIEKEKE